MGNWRRANVIGTVDDGEVGALRKALTFDPKTYEGFGPLSNGGIAGLPMWATPTFNVVGNLGERGYDEESIAEHLETLAEAAPSLRCVVHLGGDYETDDCVKTITIADGKTQITEPQVDVLGAIPEAQMQGHLMAMLSGGLA